jgi:chromate reductase, NAD(P)H dehydrogenase (quinone)
MATTTTLIGIAGSLRRGSYNAALLRAAVAAAPATCRVETVSIRGIPLYDGDLDTAQGPPDLVRGLKDRLAAADGLLLATPEYNGSIPGVLKNAIDWLSRPARDLPRVFGGLAVGLMGATPGRGGTRMAQIAWLPVLRALGAQPWFGRQLNVAVAHEVFDQEGRLTDDPLREQLAAYMAGFAEFAAWGGAARRAAPPPA